MQRFRQMKPCRSSAQSKPTTTSTSHRNATSGTDRLTSFAAGRVRRVVQRHPLSPRQVRGHLRRPRQEVIRLTAPKGGTRAGERHFHLGDEKSPFRRRRGCTCEPTKAHPAGICCPCGSKSRRLFHRTADAGRRVYRIPGRTPFQSSRRPPPAGLSD